MGLFSRLFRPGKHRAETAAKPRFNDDRLQRRCQFELMEARQVMAAHPLTVGMTYLEEDAGKDLHGDTFEVQFEGGVPGSELTRLVLNTDQNLAGYSVGDLIFDTVHDGMGADEAYGFKIISSTGIDQIRATVQDGGMQLVLEFQGFHAGEKLVFAIDVDEIQQFNAGETDLHAINEGIDPIASGVEFQGSQLTTSFSVADYFDITGNGEFRNAYDKLFNGTNLLRSDSNPNGLPNDDYLGKRDRSTGVAVTLVQQPIPVSISGYVYRDDNDNGLRDAGELPLAGIAIRVIPFATVEPQSIITVYTDAFGYYRADGLSPGTYRLVESEQPTGFLDGKDTAGTVNGKVVGTAINPGDQIDAIVLRGGDRGIDYNFGEIAPASIRGQVHLSSPAGDCDGPGSQPLANVEIRLLDANGILLTTVRTDTQGRYEFQGLRPGIYQIVEVTPAGLLDGSEQPGTVDGFTVGTIVSNDTIGQIALGSGRDAIDYDFCEHLPSSLSGFVFHDRNNNGQFDAGEAAIPGVQVELYDQAGLRVGVQTTDASGAYTFSMISAGRYTIVEIQPASWLDGKDSIGAIEGVATGIAGNDRFSAIELPWGAKGVHYNFGELQPGSIEGVVHLDIDGNCEIDPYEQRLSGVTIHLLDSSGQELAVTKTDVEGRYKFDQLPPGVYQIREEQLKDVFHSGQDAGSGGGDASIDYLISNIWIASGQQLVDYNFCEQPPASLSGYVFQDGPAIISLTGEITDEMLAQRDGQYTPDDTPLAGIVLELRNGIDGTPIDASEALPGYYPSGPIRVRTDSSGRYEFRGLRGRENYAVFEVQPVSYSDGIDTPGTTSGVAFNQGEAVPEYVLQTLTVSPNNDAIVRIPLGIGRHSELNNFSEIRVVRIPPLPEQIKAVPWSMPTVREFYAPAPATLLPQLLPGIEPMFIYGSSPGVTWHLSIVDAGSPRGFEPTATGIAAWQPVSLILNNDSWGARLMQRGEWTLVTMREASEVKLEGEPLGRSVTFGLSGGRPVAGDFNGDGICEVGIYYRGEWFIDVNGNGVWDEDDLWAKLGGEHDLPVVGDWDGDGKDDIGIFGPEWAGDRIAIAAEPGLPDLSNSPKGTPKNMPPRQDEATDGRRVMQLSRAGRPRSDVIDHVFRYGRMEDLPIAGDWDGDGIDSVGVFCEGRWVLDHNGDGRDHDRELTAVYGQAGDLPIVGDFDGDGIDEIGVYRRGVWYIDSNHNREMDAHDKVFELGSPDDRPTVGDWDGDGIDDPGVYRSQASPPNSAPVSQQANR